MRNKCVTFTIYMKHCHVANGQGHPRRKIPKFPDGVANVPRRGGAKAPRALPVAPRMDIPVYNGFSVTTQSTQSIAVHDV